MAPISKDIPLGVYPKPVCHKCGKRYWDNTIEAKTWSCLYCGNLIYFSYGAFKQQIDLVMESSRHSGFVKSPCGQYIIPKTSESLRRLRFGQKTDKGPRAKCS